MKWIIALLILMVVAACGQTETAAPAAPVDDAEDEQEVVFIDSSGEEEPEPEPLPTKIEMDAATLEALNKNLGPGKKVAVSSPRVVIPIGESAVVGVAWRALNQPSKEPITYRLEFRLVKAYDKYTNLITRETDDIAGWFARNQNRVAPYAFEPVSFINNGEYRQAFAIDVKEVMDNGKPTKPGLYDLEFKVMTPRPSGFTKEYTQTLITVQVTD